MPKLPDKHSMGATPLPRPSTYVAPLHGYEGAGADAQKKISAALRDLGETYDRVQDQNDKVRAEDAYNQLINKKTDLTLGEDGFTKKKSSDAANGNIMQDYGERFDKASNEIGDSLTTPRQKAYFRSRANIAAMQYKQDMLRHVTAETDIYQKEVFGSTLSTETTEAGRSYHDDNKIKGSLVRISGSIDAEGDRLGWSKKKIKQAKLEAGSTVHATVIMSAIDADNLDRAQSYFSDHEKDMTLEQRSKIRKILDKSSLTEFGQAFADETEENGWTEAEAIAKARKRYSGAKEEEAVKATQQRFQEKNQATQRQQRAAGDDAWSVISDAEPQERAAALRSIPDSTLEAMDPKERLSLEKYIKNPPIDSDLVHYEKLLTEAKTNPRVFVVRNLEASRHLLSDSDYKMMVKLKTDLMSGKRVNVDGAQTRDQISKGGQAALLGVKPEKLKNQSQEKRIAARQRIDVEIQQFFDKNQREPDNMELQKIVDDLTVMRTRERLGGWWFDEETKVGEIRVEGVPAHEVDDIARGLIERGVDASEAAIKEEYILNKMPAGYVERLKANLLALGKKPSRENIIKAAKTYYPEAFK